MELLCLFDLVIATPFLQAASRSYAVTLVAKPYAVDLQKRFWPEVRVEPFVAPWTAFKHKYRLLRWPWREMLRLQRRLVAKRFDFGLSARWDPRDHVLLLLAQARRRLGFARWGSQMILSAVPARPDPTEHRYEHWRVMARQLGIEVPPRAALAWPRSNPEGGILVHTGAGQPVRVWPLERYHTLVARLRRNHHSVQIACDPDQREWWVKAGETNVAAPRTVTELFALVDRAGAFIGNDSGPGHLAAFCGVPTFTLFGPQMAEWFAPLNPASEWLEGKACPYKPCSDYCRFPTPHCMFNTQEDEVGARVEAFVARVLRRR